MSTVRHRPLLALPLICALLATACQTGDTSSLTAGPASEEPNALEKPLAEDALAQDTDVEPIVADVAEPVDDEADLATTIEVTPDGGSASSPDLAVSAAADRSYTKADEEVAALASLVLVASADAPDSASLAELIAALTRLEEALDADAIRAVGDDPLVVAVAGPVEDLDNSVIRVIGLISAPAGPADYLAALTEASAAIERWEQAVPAMEAAWADAVARWSSGWEQAVVDWETAWNDAAAEWEQAWADTAAEWEQAWADTVAEWEQAWEQAAVEWETAWEDAVARWLEELTAASS